jgi:hypothetical protein
LAPLRLSAANKAGAGYKAGIGTTAIGGKFDVDGDERRGISVAMYPQLEFAPAHGAGKGFSEAGQTIVLPLLVAREFHAFTFVFTGELENRCTIHRGSSHPDSASRSAGRSRGRSPR